ncbi:MAG TPA: MmgE/PrpD family protein [Advenella sp.]|nr:MmgE/PrpD family protein [Advenella sp.]
MTDPVTARFAQLISNMAVENMPVAATEQIRWRVLGALATTLSAEINPGNTAITRTSASRGSQPTLPASGHIRNQPVLSALATGAMLDIRPPGTDAQTRFMTWDAAIISAAWAHVQACESSGHTFMSALAAGYLATGILADLPDIERKSAWRAGAMSGTVGAAAAAARASGLPAGATLQAMAFAAAQAAQLAENAATMIQTGARDATGGVGQGPLDLPGPGRAAMDGMLSARMAALGGHCSSALLDQLALAMGGVNPELALSEAWAAVLPKRPCTRDQAIHGFRKQIASVISEGEAETLIGLILRLEQTAPGELSTYMHERIGSGLDS